jgi:uncharacterized protein YecE (DUF72 family)
MVWSQPAGIHTPPIVTTDFIYIRFIGERTIDEKEFGKIQKDRVSEMRKWARRVKRVEEEEKNKELNLAIVASNNHYAGFGPGTTNMFRKMVGLSKLSWPYQVPEQQTYTNNSYRILKSYDEDNRDKS